MTDHPHQQASRRPDGSAVGDTPPVVDPGPGESWPSGEHPAPSTPEQGGHQGDGQQGAGTAAADFTPEQIDALVAERDEFLDAYRRTAADFDNFRKVSQKRLHDEMARAQGSFVERLLPVLDAIDAARSHESARDTDDRELDADGRAISGVEALAGALYGFLEKEGLQRVHPVDEPFDPNVAEAVVHEPGETEPDSGPVVSEVLRTGYLWQGRVIRAAMVKVSG